MDNNIRQILESKLREELIIIARKLRVPNYRRLKKQDLILSLLECDEKLLRKAFSISWWDRKISNHPHAIICGYATLIITIILAVYNFYLKDVVFPPVHLSHHEITFDRKNCLSEKVIYIKNRDNEPHVNIELLVFVDDLDPARELIDMELVKEPGKTSGREGSPERLPIPGNIHKLNYYIRFLNTKKTALFARIQKIDGGDSKTVAITYRSVNKFYGAMGKETVKLPIEIYSYDKAKPIPVGRAGPDSYTIKFEWPEPVEAIRRKPIFRPPLLIVFADNQPIILSFDVYNNIWLDSDRIFDFFEIQDKQKYLDIIVGDEKLKSSVKINNDKDIDVILISLKGIHQLKQFVDNSKIQLIEQWLARFVYPKYNDCN